MDGARVRLANTGTRPGREVVQVYAHARQPSSVRALARGLRGRRGRRRRGGHRRRPARPARAPALGRERLGAVPGAVHARGGPLGRRPAAASRHGAEATRILRGGRPAPPLHARRRGALRHPAGALAAGPPARGGARAHALPADVEGRRAHRGGRGSARARREGPRRGRRRAGGHGPPHGDLARGRAGRLDRRRRAAAARRRSPTSTSTTRASRSRCARARRARSSRWCSPGASTSPCSRCPASRRRASRRRC